MSEFDHAPVHPVAPRLRNGHKKPHVGPSIHDYKHHHSQTVGEHSDQWWDKVSRFCSTVLGSEAGGGGFSGIGYDLAES